MYATIRMLTKRTSLEAVNRGLSRSCKANVEIQQRNRGPAQHLALWHDQASTDVLNPFFPEKLCVLGSRAIPKGRDSLSYSAGFGIPVYIVGNPARSR